MGAADRVAAAMAVNVVLNPAGERKQEEKQAPAQEEEEEEDEEGGGPGEETNKNQHKKKKTTKKEEGRAREVSSIEAEAERMRSPSLVDRLLRLARVLKASCVLLFLAVSAFVLLLFFSPFTFFALRLFSLHWSRRLTSSIFGYWLAMWPFLFEKINKTRVIVSGKKLPDRERVILICNHRTEVDWMYLWNLALRKKMIGGVKYVMKSSVRNAPVFGWAFHVLEFVLLSRKWEMDAPVFERTLSSFKDRRDPLWLIIFPEGTDYTVEKCSRSQSFAKQHCLPKLHNVLLPRVKGFHACLNLLRGSIDAVYDVTIGYKNQCPLFIDNALGTDPREVHIHVRRIPVNDIPSDESEVSSWLMNEFSRKDELLDQFYTEGSFSDSSNSIEEELSVATCIFNFCTIMVFSCIMLMVIFSSLHWVKVYVAFSCVFLTAATYLNYKPVPILNI